MLNYHRNTHEIKNFLRGPEGYTNQHFNQIGLLLKHGGGHCHWTKKA